MGLRINNNIESMQAMHSLRKNNFNLGKSLQKLSTGYRINTAADGPAGLVISEQLRAQIVGLNQAVENSEQAINLVTTAEGALIEMNDILKSMRSLGIHAANEGTVDTDQIAADQAEVDSAIRSIDRIVNTTKYAKKYILNGSQDYNYGTTGAGTSTIEGIQLERVNFTDPTTGVTMSVSHLLAASAGYVAFVAGAAAAESGITLAISGNKGTDFITVAGNATQAAIGAAIDAVKENTGVKFSGANYAVSQEFGSDQFVRMKLVSGNYGTAAASDNGADAVATVNGQLATAKGREIRVDNSSYSVKITFSAGAANAENFVIGATDGGMKFQLGDFVNPNEQENVGIRSLHSTTLGNKALGYLNQLRTGGVYDLSNDPSKAVRIIDEAINQVSSLRARLGAFQKNTLQPNINSLEVAIENITSSESRIRDANMAYETTVFTKNQILVQSSTAILGQANLAAQNVLQLLQ